MGTGPTRAVQTGLQCVFFDHIGGGSNRIYIQVIPAGSADCIPDICRRGTRDRPCWRNGSRRNRGRPNRKGHIGTVGLVLLLFMATTLNL